MLCGVKHNVLLMCDDLFVFVIVRGQCVKELVVLYANVSECRRCSPQKTIVFSFIWNECQCCAEFDVFSFLLFLNNNKI